MLREINGIKMSYKSFITLERIARKQVPHERIRAVAGGQAKIQQLFGIDNITDFLDEIDDISSPIFNFIKVE